MPPPLQLVNFVRTPILAYVRSVWNITDCGSFLIYGCIVMWPLVSQGLFTGQVMS